MLSALRRTNIPKSPFSCWATCSRIRATKVHLSACGSELERVVDANGFGVELEDS